MPETQISLLCVEDDESWVDQIQDAANSRDGIVVDRAATFGQATGKLRRGGYDVVTLDSRLGGDGAGQPRIRQLLQYLPTEGITPTVVAVTAFAKSDLLPSDRQRLFDVIEKGDVAGDTLALKRRLLRAAHASLIHQAQIVCRDAGWLEESQMTEGVFDVLTRRLGELPTSSNGMARCILDKYHLVYLDHLLHLPEELLDCQGTVMAIGTDTIDAELYIGGEYILRRFSRCRFSAAGLVYENAPFRYRVTRFGAEVRSVVEPVLVQDCAGDIDLSMFDD